MDKVYSIFYHNEPCFVNFIPIRYSFPKEEKEGVRAAGSIQTRWVDICLVLHGGMGIGSLRIQLEG